MKCRQFVGKVDDIGSGLAKLASDNGRLLVKSGSMSDEARLWSSIGYRLNSRPFEQFPQFGSVGETECDMPELRLRRFRQTKRSDLYPAYAAPRHEVGNRQLSPGIAIVTHGL